MNMPRLNLVVLRVVNLDRAAAFYGLLGLQFTQHAHGSGPLHYACESDDFVFELYPSSASQPICASTRIGFTVADVDETASKLASVAGAQMITPPKDSEWGRRAVVADPDGHRVELVAGTDQSTERAGIDMMSLDRITIDPQIMAGKPCIRGTRIPVSIVLKLLASYPSRGDILNEYPDLEDEDFNHALQYAALLAQQEVPSPSPRP